MRRRPIDLLPDAIVPGGSRQMRCAISAARRNADSGAEPSALLLITQ